MIHQKIEGLILKITPFKEYDKVVTFFSPTIGVLRVVGKGVRRARSQRSYHLDHLNFVDVDLESSGKATSLWYLREIHTKHHFQVIKKTPVRYSCAAMIALFITRMIPEGAPHQTELFDLTMRALESLNTPETTIDPEKVLFNYLIKAVKMMGHIEHTLRADRLESELLNQLESLDPQFTLIARRTLSIFSNL